MRYIAVDPGLVSGVVCWDDKHPELLEWHEMPSISDVAKWVRARTESNPDAVFVTEKFIISARTIKTKVYYDSLYFNGWASIEYPDVIEQTAAQAKEFATDPILRHLGWYNKTKDGHANDAARHLVYRTVKTRHPFVIAQLEEYL